MNHDEVSLYVTISQNGGEGQGDAQEDGGTDRQMNLDRTGIQTFGNRDQIFNRIEFYSDKNPIIVMMGKVTS